MTWHPETPYNALPPLPPATQVETRKILKATVEARASLAELNQALRRIPNPSVLLNSLPLLEAQASSEIENIVTTTDELFTFANDSTTPTDAATRETLRYRAALFQGMTNVHKRPLTTNTTIDVCSTITGRHMNIRQLPGTFIGNSGTKKVIYTPPTGEAIIREKLANWESFIHQKSDIDPLVKMAIAHYQFEAIHPFDDGNGRTGRILNILMLVSDGILDHPVLYLSRFIIDTKKRYYSLLLRVTSHGEWEGWIDYILDAVRQTAVGTVKKIDAIHDLRSKTLDKMRVAITGKTPTDLVDVLFEQPYCRIASVMERCEVSRPTATSWLNSLVQAEILSEKRFGRERLFINRAFMNVLTSSETTA